MSAVRCVLATVVLCLAPAGAWAYINPDFTPIHLVDQSQVILKVKLAGRDVGEKAVLEVAGAMKGQAPAKVTLDLTTAANKQHAEAARGKLKQTFGDTALLFGGEFDGQRRGYLHVGGTWLRLAGGAAGAWAFQAVDANMAGTWAGGTDMLARCVEYVLAAGGDADVPVDSGTGWRDGGIVKAGAVKGKASAIHAVDLAGDGRLCLHLASPAGDVLIRPAKGKLAFEDVTAATKLAARSAASGWGDFDADGRLDLASWDGKALTIWRGRADGTFSAEKATGKFTIPPGCRLPATVGVAGGTGLVIGGATPLLLIPAGKGAFRAAALPAAKGPAGKWGKPQPCVVADFNNDAIPDVIQPFEKDGLLFVGQVGGGFAAGAACGVGCTPGGGMACAGDFDADGWMDVLAAGGEGVAVFHNLRNGRFRECLALSGEIAYKAQPFASWCGVGDFNNDARQDTFITYSGQQPLMYFNRGFRSFGQSPKLEMSLMEQVEALDAGQQMALLADVDDDGAQDLVVVAPDGGVWCAQNDLGGDGLGVKVRLGPRPAFAGPVAVALWQGKRCLGAFQARRRRPGFIGIPAAGKYTLKWRFPGRKEQTMDVTVEDGPVKVVLKPAAESATRPGRPRPAEKAP